MSKTKVLSRILTARYVHKRRKTELKRGQTSIEEGPSISGEQLPTKGEWETQCDHVVMECLLNRRNWDWLEVLVR